MNTIFEKDELLEKENMPWVLFKLNGQTYAVNSSSIVSIQILPTNKTEVPDAPNYVYGITPFRDIIIPMIELRALFSIKSFNQQYEEFINMLEERKQDHINWTNELINSVNNDTEFKLTTDPHKCKFGMWYDNFVSDNNAVNFQLKKLDQPHQKLHAAAHDVETCKRNCESCQHDECLRKILERVQKELTPKIVALIDETKAVFKNSLRNMLIVLQSEDLTTGIIVDEVIGVEELESLADSKNVAHKFSGGFIENIAKTQKDGEIVMLLKENSIINLTKDIKPA